MVTRSVAIRIGVGFFLGVGLVFFQNCSSVVKPKDALVELDRNPLQAQTESFQVLVGRWTSQCMTVKIGLGTSFQQQVFEFQAHSTLTVQDTFYKDPACITPLSRIVYTGTYEYLPANLKSPEFRDLNYTAIPQTVTSLDDDQTRTYNFQKKCGKSEWQTFLPVPAELCSNLSRNQYFDIVQIRGPTMQMGKITAERDGAAADRRPLAIENRYFFTKTL